MINNFSKKMAFSALKMIKYGKIIVIDYDQSKHIFGNDDNLIVFVKLGLSNPLLMIHLYCHDLYQKNLKY